MVGAGVAEGEDFFGSLAQCVAQEEFEFSDFVSTEGGGGEAVLFDVEMFEVKCLSQYIKFFNRCRQLAQTYIWKFIFQTRKMLK